MTVKEFEDELAKLAGELKKKLEEQHPDVCPACGRCNKCGRGGPDKPVYPTYPYWPWWEPYKITWGSTGG